MLNGNFESEERKSNSVHLRMSSNLSNVFGGFIQFLYACEYSDPSGTSEQRCLVHARIYVLGERFLMPDLKQLSLLKFAEQVSNIKTAGKPFKPFEMVTLVEAVYKGTPSYDLIQESETTGKASAPIVTYGLSDAFESTATPRSGPGNGEEAGSSSGWSQLSPSMQALIAPHEGDMAANRDPMRTAVARFTASRLAEMRNERKFLDLVHDLPDFAQDLVLEIAARDAESFPQPPAAQTVHKRKSNRISK